MVNAPLTTRPAGLSGVRLVARLATDGAGRTLTVAYAPAIVRLAARPHHHAVAARRLGRWRASGRPHHQPERDAEAAEEGHRGDRMQLRLEIEARLARAAGEGRALGAVLARRIKIVAAR